jgi:hypothetical protein
MPGFKYTLRVIGEVFSKKGRIMKICIFNHEINDLMFDKPRIKS